MTSQETLTEAVRLVVDALIDGLRVADPRLQDRSRQALCAIGSGVLPRLNEIAGERRTTARHRARLRELIDRIPPIEAPAANASQLIVIALIEGLRPSDARLTGKVMAALRELPAAIVSPLVTAVAATRRSPGYCLRLLRALQELGHPMRGSNQIIMFLLSQPSTPALIREEAARVLALRHETTAIECCQAG